MGNKYLVLSDLHLCEVEDHADGWKWYKHSRYLFDEDFAELLNEFLAGADGAERLILILNGDIVDFDLVTSVPELPPWPVSRSERRRGLDATEEKSAWKLERVLSQHPRFVEALARFRAGGREIVYVMGNHDREFHFPRVQDVLNRRLRQAAETTGASMPQEAIRYEPWFYFVRGEIYAEHGQQYDYYSSFHSLLAPLEVSRKQEVIALPMGNLSNRYLMSSMGFFNPHAGDFILNLFAYVAHWLRHYAWSRRSLFWNWFFGSLVVMRKLYRRRRLFHRRPPDYDRLLEETVRRSGLDAQTVAALDNLSRRPITNRFYRIIREFWLDRVLIGAVMAGGTLALALVPIPLWIKLMVPLTGFPLLFFIYEYLARGGSIFTTEKEIPKFARRVAEMLPVKIVTFGHTHVPRLLPLSRGVCFAETGSWAPIFRKKDQRKLAPGYRNYLTAGFDDRTGLTVRLDSWMGGESVGIGEPLKVSIPGA